MSRIDLALGLWTNSDDSTLASTTLRLSPVEISFLEEYAKIMGPLAKALNILQSEADVQMGWLLPTLTLLITKLHKICTSCRYCNPLVDAVQEGLQRRFADMLLEPEYRCCYPCPKV